MKLENSKVGKFVPIRTTEGIYYGGYQNSLMELGVSKFYRDRSCVVTAFTNAYLYMYHPNEEFSLAEYNKYQYEFYKRLRPHINGVPTVKALNNRVNRIKRAYGLKLDHHLLSENYFKKISTDQKIAFINEGLRKNCPVIFINWMSNAINVMKHHGVTITECNDMGDYHELIISSWGRRYKINFEIFDKQIRSYTGLIYFERKDYGIYQSWGICARRR